MKYITLESGAFLAGIANMLGVYGIECTDATIAIGMELPYLFIKNEQGYAAGTGIAMPECVNYCLHPRGFHLREHTLPRTEVGAFLRSQRCALLTINVSKATRRMMVYYGFADRHYRFINLRQRYSSEASTVQYTAVALKNRLDETVTVYTLEECEPIPVDFIAALTHAIENIWAYRKELEALPDILPMDTFHQIDQRLLKPFMQDWRPMLDLIADADLHHEFPALNFNYRYLHIHDQRQKAVPRDRLLLDLALTCLQYLQEDILDRLYAYGADDDLLDTYSLLPGE